MRVWADVALDRTMCSAVRRRMLVNGMTSSRAGRGCSGPPGAGATGGGRAEARRRRARRPGARSCGAGCRGSPAARVDDGLDVGPGDPATEPGPVIAEGSMPCSSSRRRTTGDRTGHRRRSRRPAPVGGGRGRRCSGALRGPVGGGAAGGRRCGAAGRAPGGGRGRRRRGRRSGRAAPGRGAGAGAGSAARRRRPCAGGSGGGRRRR